jgi:hypothetical protein
VWIAKSLSKVKETKIEEEAYSGTINGSQISMTGSRPSSGGITTITSTNITISGNSLSGTASWIWGDGSSNYYKEGVDSSNTVDYEHPYMFLPVPLSGFERVSYLPK